MYVCIDYQPIVPKYVATLSHIYIYIYIYIYNLTDFVELYKSEIFSIWPYVHIHGTMEWYKANVIRESPCLGLIHEPLRHDYSTLTNYIP